MELLTPRFGLLAECVRIRHKSRCVLFILHTSADGYCALSFRLITFRWRPTPDWHTFQINSYRLVAMVDSCHLLLSKFYIVLLDPAFAAVPGQVEQVLDAAWEWNCILCLHRALRRFVRLLTLVWRDRTTRACMNVPANEVKSRCPTGQLHRGCTHARLAHMR